VFINRQQAGKQLADRLRSWNLQQPVVYALPRGGVPVAAEIARSLRAPLDVVLVRKLGAPMQPELALGAIVDGDPPTITLNDDVVRSLGASAGQINDIAAAELAEIRRRRIEYSGSLNRVAPDGRTAIVVDDGIATGATARAALRALRKQGAALLILAVPVAPADTVEALRSEVDAILCVETPKNFLSVGACYEDFRQVSTAEVIKILQEFASKGATNMKPTCPD
jgi:putative phosphoribosyl transferase